VGTRNPVAGSDNILQKCWVVTYLAYRQFWDPPCLFLQPLELATSSLVHNLGSMSSMPKATFRTKMLWVWAREHPQICGMLPSPHPRHFFVVKVVFVSYSRSQSCIPNLKSLPSAVVEISRIPTFLGCSPGPYPRQCWS